MCNKTGEIPNLLDNIIIMANMKCICNINYKCMWHLEELK